MIAFNINDSFGSPIKNLTGAGSIGSLVSLLLNIAFAVAGIIIIVFFVMGGIGLIGSAGGNDPQKAESAKKTLTSAVIGFIIVFASYWIVKLIGSFVGMPNII